MLSTKQFSSRRGGENLQSAMILILIMMMTCRFWSLNKLLRPLIIIWGLDDQPILILILSSHGNQIIVIVIVIVIVKVFIIVKGIAIIIVIIKSRNKGKRKSFGKIQTFVTVWHASKTGHFQTFKEIEGLNMNSISSAILYFSITLHIALNFERTCSDMSILRGKTKSVTVWHLSLPLF